MTVTAASSPDLDGAALGRAAQAARDTLWASIVSGELTSGDRLGAERDLARDLGVSRSTLRAALAALEREGAIRRVPGRGGGTFIKRPKVKRDLSRIAGVPAMLIDQGFVAGSTVISAGMGAAEEATRRALNLEPGAHVVALARIRLADGIPISLEFARFPADRLPGLLDHAIGGSIYELLETAYGITISAVDETIEARTVEPDEALVLHIEPGSAVLCITRIGYDAAGLPVEYSEDLFRADRTVFTVHTKTSGALAPDGDHPSAPSYSDLPRGPQSRSVQVRSGSADSARHRG
jgi:GntR family transcriptional regulator